MKLITVFGGSNPKAGQPAYAEALLLGRLLGQAGYTVLTGGYVGTMEAVSRGANEAGGHVIGVTCDEIELWRQVGANAWVQENLHEPTLRQRIWRLAENCDAALALPGGPGTLTEISFLWNHMIIDALSPRPLILIGPGWKSTFEHFFSQLDGYIPNNQRRWLSFAPDVTAAYQMIVDHFSSKE